MPRKAGDTNDRWWADAIRRAVSLDADDPQSGKKVKKLRLIADRLVDQALTGDIAAIKEIGDRLDGKPAQAIVGDDSKPPVSLLHKIERVIVDPKN